MLVKGLSFQFLVSYRLFRVQHLYQFQLSLFSHFSVFCTSFFPNRTISHFERLIVSISVLQNGPRESHTRIPILTLYSVSLLVSVQQQYYIYPASDCGRPLPNILFHYLKISHFSSLFYFPFTGFSILILFTIFFYPRMSFSLDFILPKMSYLLQILLFQQNSLIHYTLHCIIYSNNRAKYTSNENNTGCFDHSFNLS